MGQSFKSKIQSAFGKLYSKKPEAEVTQERTQERGQEQGVDEDRQSPEPEPAQDQSTVSKLQVELVTAQAAALTLSELPPGAAQRSTSSYDAEAGPMTFNER